MWGVSKRRGRGRGGAGAGAETGAYLFCKESCFKVGVDTNPALILTLTITITLTLTLTHNSIL